MIAQYLMVNEEAENGVGSYTYEIKGSKEQEEYAKWLWTVTKDLSDANYSYGKVCDNLAKMGYDEDEIAKILEVYPNLVSTDVLTAYDECLSLLKELGMEINEIEDCDNPDVWTSTGVY